MGKRFRLGAVLCLALSSVAFAACEDDDDDFARLPEIEEGDLTDGEITAVLVALNGGEIGPSELARTGADRADIQDFAARMVRDHADAIGRIGDLMLDRDIDAEENDLSREVAADAAAAFARLHGVGDDAFDRHYMALQLQMHAMALDLIRDRLLPSVEDEALQAELLGMEAAVEAHLERARAIAIRMGGGTVDDGEEEPDGPPVGGDVGGDGER